MVGSRFFMLAIAAAAVSACQSSLPVPDYVSIKPPAPYRDGANGTRIDNEDYAMDAEGYRLDKAGRRIGAVDVQAKMGSEASSAMAGYYVSSTGTYAPGRVMAPSEGAAAGAGYGPGSAGVTPSSMEPGQTPPPASGTPTPLAPQTK